MAVIAMTREMGTHGRDVAAAVAQRLGLELVHHELVEHDIAEQSGLLESEVHRFLEGGVSLLERLTLDRKRLARCTRLEILQLAARGNVLIRGWGATFLLRSIPHVVCVRICAPLRFRELVMMERLGLKQASLARREIVRNDAAHNGTMQKLFGIDWIDPSLYSIALNTARVPVADCTNYIVRMAESPAFQETAQSKALLHDELVGARVRQALDQRFGMHGIDIDVSNGTVVLTGASTDDKQIVDMIRLANGVEGVTRVESHIERVTFIPPMM